MTIRKIYRTCKAVLVGIRNITIETFGKNSVISSLQIEYIICSSAREKLEA